MAHPGFPLAPQWATTMCLRPSLGDRQVCRPPIPSVQNVPAPPTSCCHIGLSGACPPGSHPSGVLGWQAWRTMTTCPRPSACDREACRPPIIAVQDVPAPRTLGTSLGIGPSAGPGPGPGPGPSPGQDTGPAAALGLCRGPGKWLVPWPIPRHNSWHGPGPRLGAGPCWPRLKHWPCPRPCAQAQA